MINRNIATLEIRTNEYALKAARYARYELPSRTDQSSIDNLDQYDRAMIEHGYLDFDMIAELAFIMLNTIDDLHQSLSHYFDWIIIDEYQI